MKNRRAGQREPERPDGKLALRFPRSNPLPAKENPRRVADTEICGMIKPISKKTEKRRTHCRACGWKESPRRSPNAQTDPEGKKPAGHEEFRIPRPRSAICSDGEPVKRVAHHTQPLADERGPARVVTIPEREFAVLPQRLMREHRVRPMADLDDQHIGAFEVLGFRGVDARNRR